MYKCNAHCETTKYQCDAPCYVNHKCQCECPKPEDNCPKKPCKDYYRCSYGERWSRNLSMRLLSIIFIITPRSTFRYFYYRLFLSSNQQSSFLSKVEESRPLPRRQLMDDEELRRNLRLLRRSKAILGWVLSMRKIYLLILSQWVLFHDCWYEAIVVKIQ